jgi:hypothetical protein
MRIAAAIARALSHALHTGFIDADLATSTITPIFKAGDVADHDCYRGIAVGTLLPKILSCVITTRLQHWISRHHIIGPPQIGFMPGHGAEEHVFTLMESIKARARAGKPTVGLFVDLKKAYDRVHLSALWILLRLMGIPNSLVDFLAATAASRNSTLRVNGTNSTPFPVSAGLAQGDPLSPILFNLYFEPHSDFSMPTGATLALLC